MKKLLVSLILIIALKSCTKKVDCTDPPIEISFISFSLNELNLLILRKFTADNNFQNLIDTLRVNSGNASIIIRGDTTHISLYDPNNSLKPGFDWQLFIPAVNRTVAITNIIKNNKTGKCGALARECFCYNVISSLKVDNQNGVLQTYPGHVLFIRR